MRVKLIKLHFKMNQIFSSNRLSWEEKYDRIFSNKVSKKIHRLIDLDYHYANLSYEEDATSFVTAVNEYVSSDKFVKNVA